MRLFGGLIATPSVLKGGLAYAGSMRVGFGRLALQWVGLLAVGSGMSQPGLACFELAFWGGICLGRV